MSSIKDMLTDAVAAGYTICVYYDDPDEPDYTGQDVTEAMAHVTACDEIHVRLEGGPNKGGRALIIPSLADDEQIADFTLNTWIERWWDARSEKEGA